MGKVEIMNRKSQKLIKIRFGLTSVAVAAILSCLPHASRAAPLGGVVASGVATISAAGPVTTINQSTDRAVIDWRSFNLSPEETARFIVPSDSGATLNRITGGVSTISGSVESNGTVYFSNPNGLVFDATSRVGANGFFVTTGSISNFDFMNRGEFSNLGSNAVTLNGVVSAPAITALAGTVSVGGNLSAGSGKILLSSTNLTTIGVGATIAADGASNATGGTIKIWSDNHTDYLGRITAGGGFVEVSGKQTLNFSGRVSTLSASGKAGTLLLDPVNVEIVAAVPATPVDGVSYITAAKLKEALEAGNVRIDATNPGISNTVDHTTPTGTVGGSGILTLFADPAPQSGSYNLTLGAAQIILRSSLTLRGELSLNATRTSVWQATEQVITATKLSGGAIDGFSLNGANKIEELGAITNQNFGGILVTNSRALSVEAGIMLDGGKGGVFIDNKGTDLTLQGPLTAKGSYLRLDLREGGHLLGGQTITASGVPVFLTSATSGNLATIAVGGGSFTFVTDKRTVTTLVSLDNNTEANTATIGWGSGLGTLHNGTEVGGLTVTTSGDATTINNQGVVYGGAVELGTITTNADGTITNTDLTTGAATNLRWIEGTGVSVIRVTSFSGSIALVGSGNGIHKLYAGQNRTQSLSILQDMTVGNRNERTGNLTLIQRNGGLGSDSFPSALGVVAANPLRLNGIFITSVSRSPYLTVGGDMSAVVFGTCEFPIELNTQVDPTGDSLVVGGNMSLAVVGYTSKEIITVFVTNMSVGGNFTMIQSGTMFGNGEGLRINNGRVTAGGDISLIQSGIMGSSTNNGLVLAMSKAGFFYSLDAGSDSNWVTLRSTQNLTVSLINFTIPRGKVRIDLGSTRVKISATLTNPPDSQITLNVRGREVFYTGATSASGLTKDPIIDVGTTGSFTFVNDKRTVTSATEIDDSTTAGIGWGSGLGTLTSGTASTSGLKIIGKSDSSNINYQGVVYGGTVALNGITTTSAARNLRYIEGSGIGVTGASRFTGSLMLVGSGSGFQTTVGADTVTAGIMVAADLSTGTVGDHTSHLTMIQRGYSDGSGIEIANATVRAGGNLAIVQYGGVGISSAGIMLAATSAQSGVSLIAGGSDDQITIQTSSNSLTLANFDNFSTSNGKIRIDLGSGALVSVGAQASTFTLKSYDQDVLFTGAASGNSATLAMRNGSFTRFKDLTFVSGNTTIDDNTSLAQYGLSSFGGTVGNRTSGGLRITGNNDALIRGLGIKFGGTVTIDGVMGGEAANLNYLEASGIAVINNESRFAGALRLVSSGAGIVYSGQTNGILVGVTLSTGTAKDRISDLSLVQSGSVNGIGILVSPEEIVAGGAMTISQSSTATATAGVSVTTAGHGIKIQSSKLSAGRGLTISQAGTAKNTGIILQSSTLTAADDLSVLQSGSVGTTAAGIDLIASGLGKNGVNLNAGLKDGWVRLVTKDKNITLSDYDNFVVKSRNLRLDTGTATIISKIPASDAVTFNYRLQALGLDVFLTAQISPIPLASAAAQFQLDLGNGTLTRISNRSADTNSFAITNSTTLADLGISANNLWYSVNNNNNLKNIGDGVIFGGTVTVNGVTTGDAKDLRYIEATGIGIITAASSFTGPLTLVSTGGGVSDSGNSAGIVIGANLSVGSTGTPLNGLSLVQSGAVTGSGILVTYATVTVGGNLTMAQSGTVTAAGIALKNAALKAGGDLSLTASGSLGSGKAGIELIATGTTVGTGVIFAAGLNHWVNLTTAGSSLELSTADNFAITSGRVRLDLGAGALVSTDASGVVLATPNSLKVRDLELFYSGATSGNSAKLDVTGGKFTFVNDRRAVTVVRTLNNSSTAANDWGVGLGTLTSGTASPSGLTVLGTNINNQGVVYGVTVTIDGVTSGTAQGLTYIEASAIVVSNSTSSFSGGLSLVSSGGESSIMIGNTTRTAGIMINNSSLTTGAVGDRASNLHLVQKGFSAGQGILVFANSSLRAGGNLLLTQLGTVQTDGIMVQASALTAGGDLGLLSYGITGNSNMGLVLSASGTATGQGVTLTGGGSNSWVILSSLRRNLQLNGADNFTVAGGKLRLDLWGAALVSSGVVSGGSIPNGGYSLKATDLEVYYTSAKTGNSAKIVVAGGSFTFVNDQRSNAATAAAVTLNSSSAATVWGTGLGSLTNNSALGGLTVSTTGAGTLNNLGVVFGGAVTVEGITSSNAASSLRYIEGSSVTVQTTASVFTGSLVLASSSPDSIQLGANLTTLNGSLSLLANGLKLTNGVTTSTTGGTVAIDLGTFGVYDNGSGFSLGTSGGSLDLRAARITNLGAGITIFSLGAGRLTLSGGMAVANRFALPAVAYQSNYINAQNDTIFKSANPVYTFTSLIGDALTTAQAAVAEADPNALWLDATAFNQSSLGTRQRTTDGFEYSSTGFSQNTGDIVWQVTGDRVGTIETDVLRLSDGRALVFYGVNNQALPAMTPTWLSQSNSILFKGTNSFNSGLALSTQGSISQAEGSTLTVTGGNLSITGATTVTLANGGNSLGTVGAITTSGNLSLQSNGALTVSGSLNSSGNLTLAVQSPVALTVTGTGTLAANTGTVTITLATGSSLSLDGNVTSQGAINITSSGSQGSLGSAAVTVNGTLTTTVGSVTLSLGGRSTATVSGAITTQGKVQLGLGLDSSLTVGTITTDGDIAINLGNRGTMAIGGDLLAKGAVSLSLDTGSTLTVTKALRSSGTGVTVDLNGSTYDNLNGAATTATNGFAWTHEVTNLTLNLKNGKIRVGGGTVFDLSNDTAADGVFTLDYDTKDGINKTKNLYFSNSPLVTTRNIQELTNDANAELLSLQVLDDGIDTSRLEQGSTGLVSLKKQASRVASNPDAIITFWNVRDGEVLADLNVKEIRFAGQFNSFRSFAPKTGTAVGPLTVVAGSSLSGAITVGAGRMTLEPGASLGSGTISTATELDLSLNFLNDYFQVPTGVSFSAGRNLVITSNGYSVRLMNRGNGFAGLEVTTNGGNFQIAAGRDLSFNQLDTAGGWVVLETTGSITANRVSAGSVSFRAGGSVSLTGAFAAASGSGSSVSLNGSSSFVLGGIRSDSSVAVGGTGLAILVGDIVGTSSVNFGTTVAVARDSTVATSGGRIEFARTVAALNAVAGLRLDAGQGGVIALGGNIGSPSLSFGWVELNGEFSNPSSYGIYYPGGSLTSSDPFHNWRNGKGL